MKPRRLLLAGMLVLIFSLMILLPAYAADDVIKGKLNNNGKGLLDSSGKQYTIIPSENMEGELAKHVGKQVELTGVAYVNRGRNMITAYSYRLSD